MARGSDCALRSAALLATLAVSMLLPMPPATAAQQAGLKDMVYVSPTWGYTVRWYASEWVVADESSQGETDNLTLQDALGNTVSFTGTPGFDGDAVACLDEMTATLLATPGAADPESVLGDFDAPYESREPEQAYSLMQVRLPVGGVLVDHAVYLECQTLVPGEAVFQRRYAGPVGVLDQWYDDIVETLEGVDLPASAWLPMPDQETALWTGYAPLCSGSRTNAVMLRDEQDQPRLLVGLADAADDVRVVSFENVSDQPVTVAPANLVLDVTVFDVETMTDKSVGTPQPPYTVTWEDGGTAEADGSRVLQPGERASVQVAIAPVDTSAIPCGEGPMRPTVVLEYRDAESGQTARLDSNALETCVESLATDITGSGASGRPKLRLSR